MAKSASVDWLSAAIEQSVIAAKYCVSGTLPVVDPGLMVEGLGPVKLPLKQPKRLLDRCQVAPYGKGTKTLVDKEVRNTFELDPKQFRLSDAWNAAIADATRTVAEDLGLPADQLEAKLYKLLVYEKGGFFLPHRDSEKHDGMVASMIVVLPNPFEGGTLEVRHGAQEESFAFKEAAAGKAPCYAAFYADCEHEVHRVERGVRLCLAYNLVLRTTGVKVAGSTPAPVAPLVRSIETWIARQPGEPLVFALEHHYTERGLSLELLKGTDRSLADHVVAAAEQAGCIVHLAEVERHLCQFATDGSGYDDHYSSRRRSRRSDGIRIGETYEDELSGKGWTDLDGKKQPWGTIRFALPAIVSATPLDDWKPTTEEYEGYTGNAGNTLDRWYHRSALVLWSRDQHFDVVAASGAGSAIPLFISMVAKLAKTAKKRIDEARADCVRFARAILAHWPRRLRASYDPRQPKLAVYDEFADLLPKLHDRDTIAAFLTKLAEFGQSPKLGSLVLAACREFGWGAFAKEMTALLEPSKDTFADRSVPANTAEWIADYCGDPAEDADKTKLAGELCARLVERFCEPIKPDAFRSRDTITNTEKALPHVVQALLANGSDDLLTRVLRLVQDAPASFSMDDCVVPSLKSLIAWSKKRFGTVHPQLASWLAGTRRKLEADTAAKPAPPADWKRPATLSCNCKFCGQLQKFLADPAAEVTRIPAAEHTRRHLQETIGKHQCDVKSDLERKGSPYSLVLTKTTGSYERGVKRYEADLKLLKKLPASD